MTIDAKHDAYICFKLMYLQSKCLYIWLHMAIYTHICIILVPESCSETYSQCIYTQEARCTLHPAGTATVHQTTQLP